MAVCTETLKNVFSTWHACMPWPRDPGHTWPCLISNIHLVEQKFSKIVLDLINIPYRPIKFPDSEYTRRTTKVIAARSLQLTHKRQ